MRSLRHGWFHLATGASFGRAFGFVGNLLLSRWLGPADLGLFNLVTTTVQTTDTVVRCGGDYALNFELGGHPDAVNTESGVELAHAFVQICSWMTGLACVGFAVWIFSARGLFPTDLPESQRIFMTVLLLVMISSEGIAASAWEVLLVSHRTALLAMRQALFVPLRLLSAALGALIAGVFGAMMAWSFVALAQCLWLSRVLGDLWQPLKICSPIFRSIHRLLRRGLPFYGANLVASLIFYPLLLMVAKSNGLAEIGYLRIGQILQQLFAFLPSTLVPVLFLRLRAENNLSDQVAVLERPLRIIWLLLLQVLLIYFIMDKWLIPWIFGFSFSSALLPTRLLLLTALFECIAQLLVQPLLAAGLTRMYSIWQCGAAISSAILGWLTIPSVGLSAYLVVRLLYVIMPLIGFGVPIYKRLRNPSSFLFLFAISALLLFSLSLHAFLGDRFAINPALSAFLFLFICLQNRRDAYYIVQLVSGKL